jgi:hypothetical protein
MWIKGSSFGFMAMPYANDINMSPMVLISS